MRQQAFEFWFLHCYYFLLQLAKRFCNRKEIYQIRIDKVSVNMESNDRISNGRAERLPRGREKSGLRISKDRSLISLKCKKTRLKGEFYQTKGGDKDFCPTTENKFSQSYSNFCTGIHNVL